MADKTRTHTFSAFRTRWCFNLNEFFVMKPIGSSLSFLFQITSLFAIATMNCFADTDVMSQASQLELNGKFKEAATSLKKALDSKTLPKSDRMKLEFELDRLER